MPLYKRAVELDSNFAGAYSSLAIVYGNLNQLDRAAENASKAYALREKVTDRERFSIEAFYYWYVTGELEKVAQVYRQWQQTYPRDYAPYVDLAIISGNLGRWDQALEQDLQAMAMEPSHVNRYSNLGIDYIDLNRLEEAEAVFKQAETRKLEGEILLQARYQLAFLKGDRPQMAHILTVGLEKPGAGDALLAAQADTEGWHGNLKSARELTRRAIQLAQRNDAPETAAAYQVVAALREAGAGNSQQARADAIAAMKLGPNRDVRAMAALALAQAGDTAQAERLAVELDREVPRGTLVQGYWLPTIRAAVALQHKDPNRAIELLQQTSPIELGQPAGVTVLLCPVYLRGEAYLMRSDGKAAAAEFQKFINHYGMVGNFPWGALARLGLARSYALDAARDPAARETARTAYQNFLSFWNDADPDIPIYKQAKAEYANLQ